MVKVRVINGTYGYKDPKSGYVTPVKAGDPPIEVTEEKARRLVDVLHVAEYVEVTAETDSGTKHSADIGKAAGTTEKKASVEPASPKKLFEKLTPDSKIAEMKAVADLIGLKFKFGTTKAEAYKALAEAFTEAENADNAGRNVDSGEDAPNLSPEEPT